MQVFQSVKLQNRNQTRDSIDLFVGIVSPLDDPFNLFFRLQDIQNPDAEMIYFYAYSMGKKKIILWGIYLVEDDEFVVDSSCKYNPNYLLETIKIWKSNNYEYYGTNVRNRFTDRIEQNVIFEDRNYRISLVNNYKDLYLKAPIGEPAIEDIDLEREMIDTGKTIVKEIKKTNKKELIDSLLDYLHLELRNKHNDTLVNYVYIYAALVLFLTSDDYKVCKYILAIANNKQGVFLNAMQKTISESFLGRWLDEFLEIVTSNNDEGNDLKLRIANDVVTYMEEHLNMATTGVIGGPTLAADIEEKVKIITKKFEKFLTKSKYSKDTYVEDLDLCIEPVECGGFGEEACKVYEFGTSIFSDLDYT